MKTHAVLRLAKNRRLMVIMVISLADSTEKNGTHLVTVLIAYWWANDHEDIGQSPHDWKAISSRFTFHYSAMPLRMNISSTARRGENKFRRAIVIVSFVVIVFFFLSSAINFGFVINAIFTIRCFSIGRIRSVIVGKPIPVFTVRRVITFVIFFAE
uniref:Uncharacterized protein n=1 Tax=Timema monikensis TaxID=170555 RepID=A0A7R9E6V3_9NEOP|nr:unnamed protein product [Timema monikensis]